MVLPLATSNRAACRQQSRYDSWVTSSAWARSRSTRTARPNARDEVASYHSAKALSSPRPARLSSSARCAATEPPSSEGGSDGTGLRWLTSRSWRLVTGLSASDEPHSHVLVCSHEPFDTAGVADFVHRPARRTLVIPGGRMPGMPEELVHYAVTGAVATITLDSPHNRNAL